MGYDKFLALKSINKELSANMLADDYPQLCNHKIAIDENQKPLILLHSVDSGNFKLSSRRLRLIDISFNQSCKITEVNGQEKISNFTIIKLKTDDESLQRYFFRVCNLFISEIGNEPKIEKVQSELTKLIHLFSKLSVRPKKTIQGLFAELVVINCSSGKDKLVEAWHREANDLFDFNDSIIKIEVKSTVRLNPIHRFSHEQLNQGGDNTYIASVLIRNSGSGKDIFALSHDIQIELQNIENKIKLNDIIAETLGSDISNADESIFDYEYSKSSLKFIASNQI